ncbi:polymorphic toxin-type HINT domain-containing protein, partial [Streptomyces hydrogenans]|uniref:polymorphic toxin-type HINT domain-containing protein n=1 Tax=Streptomyces hydrogenans TaxID=1873719 RepID=UPI0036CBDBEE
RDAANSAAAHANKSADYADDAAAHAGNAATYAAQAQKNAEAAQAAATVAKTAVTKAQSIFALARETETADLLTRTDAAVERARTAKVTSESMISASAAVQKDALALHGKAAALAEEAARPDVDIQATAAKGRELAFQAMRMLGPWHQEAGARALAGTDQDVLDYLRTRWKEADESDVRQRVVELTTQSPYASVRAAAVEALKGTPGQIEAFYKTGQYDAGRDDMRVEVARLATIGDTSVQTGAKAALADGSSKALATYLKVGQYGDRLTDEKVITARLATIGGDEVRAAAKIALAGPPELIHEFITTGQHMAKRKDNLATNHVHQVQVLIDQGKRVAAKAQEDAYRAAQAAALAKGAQAEADQAASNAKASAAEAEGYKNDADASADAAEQSAEDAAASAASARNAANEAAQDAAAAENSVAEAEFSAAYARASAQRADDSANQARSSAIAAGKSAAEAEADAKAAWTATRELAEKEIAEARKLAAEERKRQEEAERASRSDKRVCVPHPTRETMAYIMPCAASPGDSVIQSMPEYAKDPIFRTLIWEVSGLADIQECIENPSAYACVMGFVGITPWGKLKYLAKIDNGIDSIKGLRAVRRSAGCLAELAENIPHSFPAGTKVLMADGTHRPIEQIKVGDQVTATDPTTDETGPRTVTRTIHTPDDRNFTDLTFADGSTLTSTSHHPYWSENDQRWKNAADLKAGDTLRTPQDSAVSVAGTRDWQGLQSAYNLTVDDLHTYYVFTGSVNVLVHNVEEGTSCPIFVKKALDKLPPRSPSMTSGYVYYPDGTLRWNQLLNSGKSPLSEKINEFLKTRSGFPDKGYIEASHHAEVKLAWDMSEKMGPGAVLHIVINNNYVCPKVTTRGAIGCQQAVPSILYDDQELWVHFPGKEEGIKLKGTRKR